MLVTIERGDRRTHLVFDTGMTPDGMTTKVRRLGIDAGDIDVPIKHPAPGVIPAGS